MIRSRVQTGQDSSLSEGHIKTESEHPALTKKHVQNWVYLDRHFSSAAQRREYMWALWIYVEAWT